ncbi:MAG: TIGR03915 family putative DNA repair protein [Paludibacter sp.]|nr:TIGR03915 family putative DNA repair protein [Paludibacter sp.]
MIIFHYDKTFEGLLTAVFDAYNRKTFPDRLMGPEEVEPLFVNESFLVITDNEKSGRVWKALEKKLSGITLNMISYVWLSELPGSDELIFRYIRKTFESKISIEMNFADEDVLQLRNIAQKVNREKHRVIEFVRFQKTADGIFFAPIAPEHNVLSLTLEHFTDRFADQQWIIYDTKRDYGYFYNLKETTEITLDSDTLILEGKVNEELLDPNEQLFQRMWKSYFKSMAIKERINPKLHRQHLPVRFWKYLTEKQ